MINLPIAIALVLVTTIIRIWMPEPTQTHVDAKAPVI